MKNFSNAMSLSMGIYFAALAADHIHSDHFIFGFIMLFLSIINLWFYERNK